MELETPNTIINDNILQQLTPEEKQHLFVIIHGASLPEQTDYDPEAIENVNSDDNVRLAGQDVQLKLPANYNHYVGVRLTTFIGTIDDYLQHMKEILTKAIHNHYRIMSNQEEYAEHQKYLETHRGKWYYVKFPY